MSPLQTLTHRIASINRAIEELGMLRSQLPTDEWQRKHGALAAQRDALTRSRRTAPRTEVSVDHMSDAAFRAYSDAYIQECEDDAREKLAIQEKLQREAETEEARHTLPADWHRTFRGTAVDLDRAREQLGRPGVFGATHRIIEGIASTPEVNSHKYAVDPLGVDAELPVPLLVKHHWNQVIGKVTQITREADAVRFQARVANAVLPNIDQIWNRIVTGEFAGVSTDSSHVGDYDNASRTYRRWRMCEVSITERGANPSARILVARERTGERDIVLRQAGIRAIPRAAEPAHREHAQSDIEARVAALESRRHMQYRGTWSGDEEYGEGDVVTDRGSMHICLRSTRARPGTSDDWKLTVKQGHLR